MNDRAPTRGPDAARPALRVVFLVRRFHPDVGGVEKYVEELARALVASGHRVDVVAGDPTGARPRHERRDGISLHRFPSRRSPWRAWGALAALRSLLRRADVVHLCDVEMFELYHRMLAWWVGPRPVFLTRHGMSGRDPVPESERARSRRARAFVDAIFDDGTFIQRRVGVRPDVVPEPGLRPPADALPRTPEPPPDSAVFVGRLEPDSGIDLYLDALVALRERFGIGMSLDVYGDGSLAGALRDRAARARLPVLWHGRVADAQERIPGACFAFVSGRLAILEAMARRRIVIAAYVDPMKRDYVCGEWFSDLIIKGKSGPALASCIAYHARHADARRGIVERAVERVRRLTWDRTAATYVTEWTRRLRQPDRPTARLSRRALMGLAWQLRKESRRRAHDVPDPIGNEPLGAGDTHTPAPAVPPPNPRAPIAGTDAADAALRT